MIPYDPPIGLGIGIPVRFGITKDPCEFPEKHLGQLACEGILFRLVFFFGENHGLFLSFRKPPSAPHEYVGNSACKIFDLEFLLSPAALGMPRTYNPLK